MARNFRKVNKGTVEVQASAARDRISKLMGKRAQRAGGVCTEQGVRTPE